MARESKHTVHPNGDRFSCFILQGKYYGEWDDLTAETSLEAILKQRETYTKEEPGIPLRIQAETISGKRRLVRIGMSHMQPRRPYIPVQPNPNQTENTNPTTIK